MTTSPPRTMVYLFGSLWKPSLGGSEALLELTDRTVRCTLTSGAGYSRWLAERLRMPDLKQRLDAGQHVTVFEFPLNGYVISWPVIGTGDIFQIGDGNNPRWIVRFSDTGKGYGTMYRAGEVHDDRPFRRQWRDVLNNPQIHPPDPSHHAPATPVPRQEQRQAALPPPGWYPDPSGARAWRYWDGTQWGPT